MPMKYTKSYTKYTHWAHTDREKKCIILWKKRYHSTWSNYERALILIHVIFKQKQHFVAHSSCVQRVFGTSCVTLYMARRMDTLAALKFVCSYRTLVGFSVCFNCRLYLSSLSCCTGITRLMGVSLFIGSFFHTGVKKCLFILLLMRSQDTSLSLRCASFTATEK